jgi:hypothetical protein
VLHTTDTPAARAQLPLLAIAPPPHESHEAKTLVQLPAGKSKLLLTSVELPELEASTDVAHVRRATLSLSSTGRPHM